MPSNQFFGSVIAGDDFEARMHFEDENGDAVSLTGALIIVTIASKSKMVRRSDTDIIGSSPARRQIEIDDDQSAEDEDDDGNPTGKGWATFRFGRERSDHDMIVQQAGSWPCDVRVKAGDNSVLTYATGRIEFVRPHSDPVV